MNPMALLLVAAGGALGSVLRAVVSIGVPPGRLPWGTMLVNVVGSLAIGWLMARIAPLPSGEWRAHSFFVVGVCGGFTTFSTFSWQTVEQLQKGAWGAAFLHVLLSVSLCLLATWAGWRLAK